MQRGVSRKSRRLVATISPRSMKSSPPSLFRIRNNRRSYASRPLALGESLPMIGRLLGHTQVETTVRYAHLAEDSLRDSTVQVAESIAAGLEV